MIMISIEEDSISGILDRTPRIAPFYAEVLSAVHKLRNGDLSSSPLVEIIHGHISALEKRGQLGKEWLSYHVPGGLIIPHVDFLTIQNEFSQLEKVRGEEPPWNAEKSIEAMGIAIKAGKQYRTRHINLFHNALALLDSNKIRRIQRLVKYHKHMLIDTNEVLVALPSHLDASKLWESFGLRGPILDRIPPWAKVYEHGLILASREYRNDDPRGHDYFSYAARAIRLGETPDMSTKLSLTWQHERSHGISDAILIDLLGLDTQNPIYEGLPGALGEDGRERKQSPSLNELLTNPYPDDVAIRRNTAYYSGARYWESLRRNVINSGSNNPWPVIIGAALDTAIDMSDAFEIMSSDLSSRISRFLRILPSRLHINMANVEKEYNAIAAGQ
jgi:hypothetical protein